MLLLVFFWLCVSLDDMKTAISRSPEAMARSRPVRFGTNAAYRGPGFSRLATLSVSASCGIQSGRTNEPISIRVRPAPASLPISRTLSSTESCADSFCSPSRGPTS